MLWIIIFFTCSFKERLVLKLGIFGGTFNPIHLGHLINAEKVLQEFSLDRILFIPSRIPVHKEMQEKITPEERAHMIELAIRDYPFFFLSCIEIEREKKSYTIITIEQLGEQYPEAEFYFILGIDAFNALRQWKDADRLVEKITFIVMNRPGEIIDQAVLSWVPRVKVSSNAHIAISSSHIRDLLDKKKSIKGLVPLAVEEYIYQKGLYLH
jgi:nicotinate-nucleotide adenylyltransferase